MTADTDSLKAVLYRSRQDRVVNILTAVAVSVCAVVAAIWWSPGSTLGKTLVLILLIAGGVLSPLAHAFLPYAYLRTGKVMVRNDWRHYAVPLSDLVGTEKKSKPMAKDVVLPVFTTLTGKVVLTGAGYEPGTAREEEVGSFIRKVEAVIPRR
jgi:hypothetical protein